MRVSHRWRPTFARQEPRVVEVHPRVAHPLRVHVLYREVLADGSRGELLPAERKRDLVDIDGGESGGEARVHSVRAEATRRRVLQGRRLLAGGEDFGDDVGALLRSP